MTPESGWFLNYQEWMAQGRPEAIDLLSRLLPPILRKGSADIEKAVDAAYRLAANEPRSNTPWYFANQERLLRWVVIRANRTMRRVKMPVRELLLLDPLSEPYRSVLLYRTFDDFRPVFELPYIFAPLTRRDIEQYIKKGLDDWDRFHGAGPKK